MTSSSDDNRGKKSMAESMQHLCLSDKFADVTFTFGKSDKLHAHRVVLSMRSPVFEAMLYDPLAAEKECEINIEDADAKTFSTFLRFFYTDTIDLNGESVLKVLYLANKYSLTILEERCAGFLNSSIDVDNVCIIHENAAIFGQTELQNRCLEFIIDHGEAVLQSDNVLTITQATLQTIISHEKLSTDEKTIFDAAVRWSRQQCKKNRILESAQNMRTQLGDVFYSIRFPLIPMETFAQEVCPSQLLTTEEENHLFRYMAAAKNSSKLGEQMVGRFSNRVRKGKYVVVNFSDFDVAGRDKYLDREQNVNDRRYRGDKKVGHGKAYRKDITNKNRKAVQYVQYVSLTLRTTSPVKLHAIVCKDMQIVPSIQLINFEEANDMEEPKNEEAEYCSRLNIEFKVNNNKIEFKQPRVLNGTCTITFALSYIVGICTQTQRHNIAKNGLNIEINYNTQIFDQLIFSK